MDKQDITREADEWLRMNGKNCRPPHYDIMVLFSQHIAALVAAAEREACAQILDGVDSYANPMTANDCADAIRARGNA